MASSSYDTFNNLANLLIFIVIIIAIVRNRSSRTPTGEQKNISALEVISNMIKTGRMTRNNKMPGTPAPPPPSSPTDQATMASTLPSLAPTLQLSAYTNLLSAFGAQPKRLEHKKRYLQVALNSTLVEALAIIRQLPISERVIIEAGTPLIKMYGAEAIRSIRRSVPSSTYIVADLKVADLADREVEMASRAGAQGATCLGVAPIETIDRFIASCREYHLDSMIDMMNVPMPQLVLKRLKKLPDVVMLHRGVDETEFSKDKPIPWYQIQQIKGSYDLLVSVAGGDSIREVQRAIFNSADIVVVWKDFYHSTSSTGTLAASFLKEIK